MNLKNKLIFYFGDQWDDMWRRRQQLACRLAKLDIAERIVYIERPLTITSFFKFLVGRADRDGTDRWKRVLRNRSWLMSVEEKLSVLTTFTPLPVLCPSLFFRFSEWFRDRWLVRRLKKHFGLDQPIVWISHPQISVDVIKDLEPSFLWYDCTEDFAACPEYPPHVRKQIKTSDEWLTEHSNVVSVVSRKLYKEKRQINSNTYWLPNAVDFDVFIQPSKECSSPPEIKTVSRPLLAFVGGLNNWAHDWELLDQVATRRPEWTILLIGGLSVSGKIKQLLLRHSNIICLGKKSYSELPSYLIHSDVCFQFYRSSWVNDTRNSQKLFLYLAAGKPIISTPSADVEEYAEYVRIVKTADEFIKGVEQSLVGGSLEISRKRKIMAQQNSWEQRIEEISKILLRNIDASNQLKRIKS